MLRYKNSLLERILMEKGIDVTAELRAVSRYDDRPPQPPMPHATVLPQTQPMPVQAVMSPLQQMHRPVIRRPQAPLPKRSMMSPSLDAVFIKATPDMRPVPTSSRNSPPSVTTMPTPPSQPPYPLPPQQGGTPSQQQEFQQLPPVSSHYPSPYQTHMEELGKLPRVLPVLLFSSYLMKELCILD